MAIQRFDIRQQTTFFYLKQIQDAYRQDLANLKSNWFSQSPYKELHEILDKIDKIAGVEKQNYASLYQKFHKAVDRVANYELMHKRYKKELDNLFIRVYENDNKISKEIYEKVIKPQSDKTSEYVPATHDRIHDNVVKFTTNPDKTFNVRHPDNPLNAFFSSMLGFGYNPLAKNNIPYVAFNGQTLPQKEERIALRIGAQTQKRKKVNPTFKRYLIANSRRRKTKAPQDTATSDLTYSYVYFNLLKRPQKFQDVAEDVAKKGVARRVDQFVRFSEGTRAKAVEEINQEKDLYDTAVITLPADGDFFLGKFSMSKGELDSSHRESLATIYEELKESILEDKNDFYLPPPIKQLYFPIKNQKQTDNGICRKLFLAAVRQCGVTLNGDSLDQEVTPAQRSAILFQFVKSNFTADLINVLNPLAFHMSCKDGIDRGEIHLVWYLLNLRYESGSPMSYQEFEEALDAAAIIVKNRPLNDNRNLLCNALKHRMLDKAFAQKHPWAQKWVADNDVKLSTTLAKNDSSSLAGAETATQKRSSPIFLKFFLSISSLIRKYLQKLDQFLIKPAKFDPRDVSKKTAEINPKMSTSKSASSIKTADLKKPVSSSNVKTKSTVLITAYDKVIKEIKERFDQQTPQDAPKKPAVKEKKKNF